MNTASPTAFQIHWSLVTSEDVGDLAPLACRLLAIWPAPVSHDVCFEAAGFTLFADNDEEWDEAAEELLRRVIEHLSRFGALKQVNTPLRDDPPWYLRPFRSGQELPILQQALFPMQCDSLPRFHAQFGDRVALRTGDGHFLLWVTLPDSGPDPTEFVKSVSESSEIRETVLRWNILLPLFTPVRSVKG